MQFNIYTQGNKHCATGHSLSQDLKTGCPNIGFIDLWVSRVWYLVHTTNGMNLLNISTAFAFLGQ